MAEFRRAQNDLKATFDRELKNLERETGVTELAATSYQSGSYDYEHSTYDPSYYDGSYVSAINPPVEITAVAAAENSTLTTTVTNGASATSGAGSTAALQIAGAAGAIASGHLDAASYYGDAPEHTPSAPAEHGSAQPLIAAATVNDTVHG